MNKYFNISLTGSYKSDMNNYNYNFDVDKITPPIPAATYFPLTNTSINPVRNNTGNTGQVHQGQSYTFVPNDGLYFDVAPTNFQELFRAKTINDSDISLWDVSNITNTAGMFWGTTSTNLDMDLSGWDVSNVTTMQYMFASASIYNQDLRGWCVTNITSEPLAFRDGSSVSLLPIWGTCPTPKGPIIYFPLRNTATNPVYQNTGNTGQSINGQSYTFVPNDGLYFDSPPTDFTYLFYGKTINDHDLAYWNVSNITNMTSMFNGANFIQDITGWDVSNVTDMSYMFGYTNNFNQDISGWNTSKVTNMSGMFHYAIIFNQDIGNWDTSNVTDMNNMFTRATVFNQNLTRWCVSKIWFEPYEFSYASGLSPVNKPVWGTCP